MVTQERLPELRTNVKISISIVLTAKPFNNFFYKFETLIKTTHFEDLINNFSFTKYALSTLILSRRLSSARLCEALLWRGTGLEDLCVLPSLEAGDAGPDTGVTA
jgi:hypothetical protein